MSPKGILRVNIGSQKGARQVNLGHGSLFYAKFSVRAGRTLDQNGETRTKFEEV